jgi:hypothetical protein
LHAWRRSYTTSWDTTPIFGLLTITALGALAVLPHFGSARYADAIGLSFANTFGVFGFGKDFIDPQIVASLWRALTILAAVQTLAGAVLIVLFGLAIRNRFRLR